MSDTSSSLPDPSMLLPPSSMTPPSVLCSAIVAPVERHEHMVKERIVSIDLRIGLHLLGEQGRKLLAEYISLKRQQ